MEVKKDAIQYTEEKRLIWYRHALRAEKRSWRNELDEVMTRKELKDQVDGTNTEKKTMENTLYFTGISK